MTDPTARDLIQRLLNVLESCELSDYGRLWRWPETAHESAMNEVRESITEARAYLATPEPAADGPAVHDGREPASVANQPSDAELLELMPETMRDELSFAATACSDATGGQVNPGIFRTVLSRVALEYARAVLARYGNRTPAPIPISDPPTEVDCDAEGRCWWWHPESFERNACWCYSRGSGVEQRWFPYWVFPVPGLETKNG